MESGICALQGMAVALALSSQGLGGKHCPLLLGHLASTFREGVQSSLRGACRRAPAFAEHSSMPLLPAHGMPSPCLAISSVSSHRQGQDLNPQLADPPRSTHLQPTGLPRRGRPEQPRGAGPTCLFFQVKINSRGLVYSVVLLLGSVALTVSFYNSEIVTSHLFHLILRSH